MKKTVIAVENAVKNFGELRAVDHVSLQVQDGEFFALLGPSGCGKTTLLRMLGGFERPSAGRIVMDGQDITHLPPNKRALNMLFQTYAVFPHMTVAQNVGYGLRMERRPTDEIARRVTEALQLVRLEEFAQRRPDNLSGGQRQRVALARALVKKPRVLLLDEPLSALDAKLREAMQTELVRLQHTVGITFIVVTHDQDEALSMANRIAVMEEGRLRQVDSPRALYEAPNCRFVANFIGRMNMHDCTLAQASDDACEIDAAGARMALPRAAPDGAKVGERLFFGLRPEKIAITAPNAAAPAGVQTRAATVEGASYHGAESLLYCRDDNGALWSAAHTHGRGEEAPSAGSKVRLQWQTADVILLRD